MAHFQEQTILLVGNDAALCTVARQEFECKQAGVRVAAVTTVDAARRVVEDAAPAVILLEESSVTQERERPAGNFQLNSAVSALAVYAPVVVIGAADHEMQLSSLLAAGAADFARCGSGSIPVALGLLEHRLQQFRQMAGAAQLFGRRIYVKGRTFRGSAAPRAQQPSHGNSGEC